VKGGQEVICAVQEIQGKIVTRRERDWGSSFKGEESEESFRLWTTNVVPGAPSGNVGKKIGTILCCKKWKCGCDTRVIHARRGDKQGAVS